MKIGEKIKKAIEKAGLSQEMVAAHADMSLNNLYKIYKRDSIESRYLVKIAEILNLPFEYFLSTDIDLPQSATGSHIQQAHQVGKNRQSISVGGEEECMKQLEATRRENQLLQQLLAAKEEMIAVLKQR